MEEFKIEKNIPIPSKNPGSHKKYPFEKMEVNDSFIICDKYTKEEMARVSSRARGWSQYWNKEYKFTLRKTEDNKIRIWIVK